MLIELGFKVYLKDPDIFCVSLLGVVTAIDNNYVTVKTSVSIKGQNMFTVPRQKIQVHEDHLKKQEQKFVNESIKEAMEKIKKHFTDIAR